MLNQIKKWLSGSTPDSIIGAIYRKDYAGLNKLLSADSVNAPDADGRTPLTCAVLAEDSDDQMVSYLVQHGADVNAAETAQRWTALHFAARDQKAAIVKLLLDAGADVDAADVFGNTPLWRCVMSNSPTDISIVKELLARGADPERKNMHGVSPMDAARNTGGPELLTLLERK